MSGWRKRQIQEREHMEFTSDDPNYKRVYYSIDPRADLSFNYRLAKGYITAIEDELVERYLSRGDFAEANAVIDRIRNDR